MSENNIKAYSVMDVYKNRLTDLYNEIDGECISDTATVKMSVIKKILVGHGGDADSMG